MFAAETLLNSSKQAVVATDDTEGIVFVNRAAEELYGWSAAEVLGKRLSEVLILSDPLAAELLFEALRAGRSWSGTQRSGPLDGPPSVVLLTGSPLPAEDGKAGGFAVLATPLDQFELPKIAAEEELRNERTQIREIMKIACIAEWRWQIDSDAIEGMPELWDILKLDPSAGLTLTDLLARFVHPDDRERVGEAFNRTRSENLPLDIELRLRTNGDTDLVLNMRGYSVMGSAGKTTGLSGVLQDVTERRQLESRLLQAERVSSLGRLAASVAHEFNNVLMGIQPFVDLLNRRAGADPTVALAAPRIADAVARGKRITQEMLRFTRIGEPARTTIDVSTWLQEFEPELAQLAGPRVKVTVEAAPALMMVADGHQLRQVFANLIVNAQHAMPDGGEVEIRVMSDTLRDRSDRLSDAVHFTIADTGIGMPEETLRYIFEPLFTTRRFGGTGLGLAVAAQVVQQHKGHIYAESTQGKGSTFHILIPAAQAPKTIAAPEVAAALSKQEPGREGTRVTLVEDDESVGAGLATILDLEGIAVDWVRLGLDAVARIAANRPDAVILDLGLPDIDGLDVYREIAKRWPGLPVLFSTGHGDETMLQPVLSAHVAYIQKPYEMQALMDALDKVIQK